MEDGARRVAQRCHRNGCTWPRGPSACLRCDQRYFKTSGLVTRTGLPSMNAMALSIICG
jgi:hypothetical protein